MAERATGLYFPALEATEAESLRLFADALVSYARQPLPAPFRTWGDAVSHLFRLHGDSPTVVVIDEFPFLVRASPSLPSIIQRELGPGGAGQQSRARLLLCGSAMSIMAGLLSGHAPLRGRAGLELVVQPFDYRNAARFWGVRDSRLAVLLHASVGGTPAYRREFVRDDVPAGLDDFDGWVVRTILNPQTPLFREARYLLADELDVRDRALYHSVLAAVAMGNTTRAAIASYIGRKSDELNHPLNVLEDCRLLAKEADVLRPGRPTYRIVEPLITFYQAIMRRRWVELESGRAAAVWNESRHTFLAQVVGPHFEALCREFAVRAEPETFGELPGEVGHGVIADPANRAQMQIDVVVLSAESRAGRRRILSLGEAKWDQVMDDSHLARLRRAQALLAAKGFDTTDTVLACYSGGGFDEGLRAESRRGRVLLVGLEELYGR